MKFVKYHSLRYRIAITSFVLQLVMVSLVLWATLSFSEQHNHEQLEQTEEVILNLLTDISSVALFSSQYDELQGYVIKLIEDPGVSSIYIANSNDIVVVSSDFDIVGKPMPKLIDSEANFWRTRNIFDLGTLAIEFSTEQVLKSTQSARNFGITIALVGITLVAGAGLFIGYLLTRRLTILTKAAANFESGDVSINTDFAGHDEIAVLGRTFEHMRKKIRTMLDTRVEERTKELAELNEKLQSLSEYDELTGVYNRRKFNEMISMECSAAARTQKPLSLFVIDIDYFKNFNDNYGHAAGDLVLKQVATSLKDTLKRPTDFFSRYGGEEFAAILPATDAQGAQYIAAAMRANVEAMLIEHNCSKAASHITISIGVAISNPNEEITPECLFEHADRALYQAKDSGKNRVIVIPLDTEKSSTVHKLSQAN